MSSLDSNGHLGELDAALGNSIASILDALMNHFMSEGLSGLSGAISGNSTSSLDNWSYQGNSFNAGTNTGSQALNIPTTVSVSTGSSTSTVITGGIAPYSIKTQPDTTIATAQISGSSLTITGITAGQTTVTVQDSSSPVKTTTTQITTSKNGTLIIDFNNPSALKNISASVSGTSLSISGGIQPYSITSQPDSSVAMAIVANNTLVIVGVNPGTSSITVQDSSTTPKTITLQITIGNETPMIANPTSISASVSNITSTTIAGGIAPYTIITPADSSIATVIVSGNTISATGNVAGNTSVTIQDSFSPAETITIPITVTESLPVGTGTNSTF
jgi:3-keto-L-gulonate-6-phosphate decarboxylase